MQFIGRERWTDRPGLRRASAGQAHRQADVELDVVVEPVGGLVEDEVFDAGEVEPPILRHARAEARRQREQLT
ncbi:MAG: hypothetical protein IPM16_12225 [Chloroflexi bacterium]|nr:hypothetical protein [Chloroflexota bacterium]